MSKSGPIASILLALLASPALFAADVLHVDAAAACPGAGTPAAPFCTIQAALDAASPGDEIVVAPGLYAERLDFLGKDVLLRSSAGPAATVVDAQWTGSVVTFANGEGAGAVLRGFTLRNGTGTPTDFGFFALAGGGVYCRDASPTIDGNVLEWNSADVGGGLALLGGSATVTGNTVRDNSCNYGGAGLHCGAGSTALVAGNSIVSNGLAGTQGGGIEVQDAAPVIEGNLIEDNLASSWAGVAIQSMLPVVVRGNMIRLNHTDEDEGGGLGMLTGPDTLIEDNDIVGNSAQGPGGGVIAFGGTLRNNRIVDNFGSMIGGAVVATNEATFDGDVIADNTGNVLAAGGQFRRVTFSGCNETAIVGGTLLLEDCLIVGNVEGLLAWGGGVATVRRCTFSGNQYSAVYVESDGHAVLESCIVWGNALTTSLELDPGTGLIDASWSIVRLGWPGVGNLDVDPLFADAAAGDYALLPGSPAIDSGDPADGVCGFDSSGMPRRLDGLLDVGSRVDRGALEFGNGRLAVSSPQPATIEIELQGTAGLPAALFAGLAAGQDCLEKWGTLGLDLGQPSLVLLWQGAPSVVVARVPTAWTGLPVVLQALVGPPGFATGNFTNAESLLLP